MAVMRNVLLKASESRWLATHLPNYPFARKAVKRFMPGELAEDALRESALLSTLRISTVITRLGENITRLEDAAEVARHYTDVIGAIRTRALDTHISVKLTQLGLDIDAAQTAEYTSQLVATAAPSPLWIDMESSKYTDITIDIFKQARAAGENVGLCVQSYLKRTEADLVELLTSTSAIRLVKGAYKEPAEIAFARKADVDQNYLMCARMLLERMSSEPVGYVPAFATHDVAIIEKIKGIADQMGVSRDRYEFQLLYGINTGVQKRLAQDGYRVRVLISYGDAWFAWYMRRLAERPANVLFLVKNLL